MDEEYRSQLTEQLRALRRLQHQDRLALARAGFSADPSIVIRAEDRQKEIDQIEAQLGIEQPQPTPSPRPTYSPPIPRREFEAGIAQRQESERQRDINHQMTLLQTHRRNLAHWRAQAKDHGGISLAPLITHNGMIAERDGIARTKAALAALGVAVEDLPGDE